MRPGERELIVNIRAREGVGYEPADVSKAVAAYLDRHEGKAVRVVDDNRGLTIVVYESRVLTDAEIRRLAPNLSQFRDMEQLLVDDDQ